MWALRAFKIVAILTPIIPTRMAYGICRLLGLIMLAVDSGARRHVYDNLRHVEPDAGHLRIYRNLVRVFMTVVTNYYDMVRMRSVDRDALLDLVEIRGLEHLRQALQGGTGAIIVSAHLGNFNVVTRYPAAIGLRCAVIAERVEPPELFAYMTRLRSAMGIEVIPPGSDALRPVLHLLREGGVLLVAGDRDVGGHGQTFPLFGRPALLPVGPVVLALRTGAALVPAHTIRLSTRKSRVVIEPPLALTQTGDRKRDIDENMAVMARAIERMIATDPGQWVVLQPLWRSPSADERHPPASSSQRS